MALLGCSVPQDAYTASKGAVLSLTRSLAVQFGPQGLRSNAICPGPIETALAGPLLRHAKVAAAYASAIPMGRVGRADEVAAAAAFLASDEASYITGAMLVVDGGLLAATGQPDFYTLLTR